VCRIVYRLGMPNAKGTAGTTVQIRALMIA
jgi:hypothetical protein